MKNRLYDLIHMLFESAASSRRIAESLDVSRRTVDRYRSLIVQHGYTWDYLQALNADALHAAFNRSRSENSKVLPDIEAIAQTLKQPGMTLLAVWGRYCSVHGARALGYSRYADLYAQGRDDQKIVMRQNHHPGEHVLTDYSGVRPSYIDFATGQRVPVELFVATLGCSHYTFVCCTATQQLPDWVDAHTRMVEFFGGTPLEVVPDNLRSAVSKSGKIPEINPTFLAWAQHYHTAVIPARALHPRDKGAVEGAVRIVQQAMLPALAEQTFYSLAEVDAAVAILLKDYNAKAFQKRAGSRESEFVRVERAALKPLPSKRFTYFRFIAKQKVPRDYHVSVLGHAYSVPHTLVGQRVEPRVSGTDVQIFHERQCVATHARSAVFGGHTTDPAHQHPNHRARAESTPEHLVAWAASIGPCLSAVMAKQFQQRVPRQGLHAAIALRDLARHREPSDLEAASRRALEIDQPHYTGVKRMLDTAALAVGVPEFAAMPVVAERRRAGALAAMRRQAAKRAA